MSGVAWGLTAALLWGCSALVLARPARILGARTTLAWTMAIGAVTAVVWGTAGRRASPGGTETKVPRQLSLVPLSGL